MVADLTAVLLAQEQVFSQFDIWKEFSDSSSQYREGIEQKQAKSDVLRAVTSNLPVTGVADEPTLDAFTKLSEANSALQAKPTTEMGVSRSTDNFIKQNIRYIVDQIRLAGAGALRLSDGYIKFIRRILPMAKLYCSMNEDLKWLLPVIEWISETLKENRPGR
ncbi:hypothetical protein [uncultured Enterovirga sp.]|uniref:hypothetical protein n=1 Tax=uncultured Enterovirga sp. TaxID=2026352 RepID=UPI0035CC0F71